LRGGKQHRAHQRHGPFEPPRGASGQESLRGPILAGGFDSCNLWMTVTKTPLEGCSVRGTSCSVKREIVDDIFIERNVLFCVH